MKSDSVLAYLTRRFHFESALGYPPGRTAYRRRSGHLFGSEVHVNTDPPKIHLPRPRRAAFPGVLAVFIGAAVGLVLGHAFLGGVGGFVLWSWARSTREGLGSDQ